MEVTPASKPTKKRRGARYALEYRTRSKRTESGWTKWKQYLAIEDMVDVDRIVAGLESWCRLYDGELRIVDREVERGL